MLLPGIGVGGDPGAMKREEHEHHDERDDDDVSETDPMPLRLGNCLGSFAENASVRRHGAAGHFLRFASLVVQLFAAVIPKRRENRDVHQCRDSST